MAGAAPDHAAKRRRSTKPQTDPVGGVPPPLDLDPETKAVNNAKEVYDKTVRSFKATIDRINKEINDTKVVETRIESMVESWGDGPLKFFRGA